MSIQVAELPAGLRDAAYIDGAWQAASGQESLPVVNPATGRAFAQVTAGVAADLDRAVAAARAAFPAFAASSVESRLALLERIHALILERAEPLARTLSQEMGAAISHARAAHVPFAAAHVQTAIDVLRGYPFLTLQGTSAIVREPIGVCGLITPWNWPLYQITAKVAPALAAGCTVVLKPSELSPLSALLFAQIVADAGAPAGVFNLVNGTGAEIGAAMAAHPDIDMISITGSNRAGVLVAQAAAPSVKRVTQELGGKSPNLMLPDTDFETAVPLGVMSAFRNVGQSCSAPTRMIVPRGELARVEAIVRATVEAIVIGDPAREETVLGPIANAAQFARVEAMIAGGMAEGARLVCGGPGRPAGLAEELAQGFFVRPTVFSDVDSAMRIAQEEIFGPVLCILAYDDLDEAVAIANDTRFGLGGHVQGTDLAQARAIALRIRTGQVHINHPAWDASAPFGGYRQSGNGREYGVFGFEEYLETKAILGFA
ncbi:aldehyde dehydrogenase family protein [Novosphingobium sp. 1949]|uniref:Aldehyde dehydrogenase family protein n=1 Tax=Novosphingobium organovorum TaxID=2930092 RepID=A0ABT0BD00_9SPHN|nr:aldehyde dehydrogenase family protein [Novosphingobium organovorum]MCJ2182936.1 aldehyde dehydrogenase family protein [Novosphingobium organovorum]